MMRRLYLQIYATFVAVLLLILILGAIAWQLLPTNAWQQRLDGTGAVIGELLIPPSLSATELQARVDQMALLIPARVTVRSRTGELLAWAGDPLPAPQAGRGQSDRSSLRGSRSAVSIQLPDDRWFIVSMPPRGPSSLLITLSLLAAAIALGAYPVARGITGRLERLKTRVEALGAGELSARVNIEGKDEIAVLARSFNRAADRIEQLVDTQQHVLSTVSHEIRTPLARMRVALDLLETENRPELRERLSQDISELDQLIGELLLVSRLDATDGIERSEEIDLLALLAEEAAHTGAEVSGTPIVIHGDPRLLRRLIRNLLENASRYASGTPIEASTRQDDDGTVLLTVADRGPGILEHERERIFEPFYRSEAVANDADSSVGLGLSLVRQIARRHGGDVRCLSRDGGGMQFEVKITPELRPSRRADHS